MEFSQPCSVHILSLELPDPFSASARFLWEQILRATQVPVYRALIHLGSAWPPPLVQTQAST